MINGSSRCLMKYPSMTEWERGLVWFITLAAITYLQLSHSDSLTVMHISKHKLNYNWMQDTSVSDLHIKQNDPSGNDSSSCKRSDVLPCCVTVHLNHLVFVFPLFLVAVRKGSCRSTLPVQSSAAWTGGSARSPSNPRSTNHSPTSPRAGRVTYCLSLEIKKNKKKNRPKPNSESRFQSRPGVNDDSLMINFSCFRSCCDDSSSVRGLC